MVGGGGGEAPPLPPPPSRTPEDEKKYPGQDNQMLKECRRKNTILDVLKTLAFRIRHDVLNVSQVCLNSREPVKLQKTANYPLESIVNSHCLLFKYSKK